MNAESTKDKVKRPELWPLIRRLNISTFAHLPEVLELLGLPYKNLSNQNFKRKASPESGVLIQNKSEKRLFKYWGVSSSSRQFLSNFSAKCAVRCRRERFWTPRVTLLLYSWLALISYIWFAPNLKSQDCCFYFLWVLTDVIAPYHAYWLLVNTWVTLFNCFCWIWSKRRPGK